MSVANYLPERDVDEYEEEADDFGLERDEHEADKGEYWYEEADGVERLAYDDLGDARLLR